MSVMNVRGKKVYIGLSGGVDSAVSAALLKQAGAQVMGVFIKGWYPPGMPCTWSADRRDAMRVAARLHIPFETLDASEEYKKSVIDYLLAEYRVGRTPNPDVMCNREVKFGAFYRYAMKHGADYIATGHYRSGEKDQSYFLWAVPKEVLEKTLFPVGTYEKSEVRRLAQKFNLPVAEKKDSQGICFLGSVSVEDFLRTEFDMSQGDAVDEAGKKVGLHESALLYTLGERVPLHKAESGPWYVLAKDIARNQLTVGKSPLSVVHDQLLKVMFEQANWLSSTHTVTESQWRYRGQRIAGHVVGNTFVATEQAREVPTPGQSIVFYNKNELVGGGIIT